MFGIFECVAEPSWQFVPNGEVDEIIPMSIEEIRSLMTENPELFTGGFRNTMKEYCRVKGIS